MLERRAGKLTSFEVAFFDQTSPRKPAKKGLQQDTPELMFCKRPCRQIDILYNLRKEGSLLRKVVQWEQQQHAAWRGLHVLLCNAQIQQQALLQTGISPAA